MTTTIDLSALRERMDRLLACEAALVDVHNSLKAGCIVQPESTLALIVEDALGFPSGGDDE